MTESTESWSRPQPTIVPRPTAAPFLLSAGVALGFAGIITSGIISLGGLGLVVTALVMWINDLRHDWKRSS